MKPEDAVAAEPIYLCFALADRAFGEEIGRALRTVGHDVTHDDIAQHEAEGDIPPALEAASICLVILSQQALGSLRMRNQARWFASACITDVGKRMWAIWREPLPDERVWRFMHPYPIISDTTTETVDDGRLITFTLQALGVTPEVITSSQKTVQIPPPTPPPAVPTPTRQRTGRGRVFALLVVALAVISAGSYFAFAALQPSRGGSRAASTATIPTSATSAPTGVNTPVPATVTATTATGLTPTATVAAGISRTPTVTPTTVTPPPPVILNAGFETPALGNGNYQYNPPGGSWTFMDSTNPGGSGIAANNSAFTSANPNAPEGTQVGVVQSNGMISQSLSGFHAGITYTLTFAVAQRGSTNTSGEDFAVNVDDKLIGTSKPGTTTYETVSFTFATTAGSHILRFQGLNSGGGDNTVFIDYVRLTD